MPRDRIGVPFGQAAGAGGRLREAAEPVLGRFAQQLGGTQVGIVLADREARVVGRWAGDRTALRRLAAASIEEGYVLAEKCAGTNGLGTALETLTPVAIRGLEHYTEPLQRFVCVGVPIRHTLTRRVEGVLNLSCPVGKGNGLLLPAVLDLGTQIEHELTSRSSLADQAVFEEFLAHSRLASAALIALSGQFMLSNSAAASLLQPSDQALLWEQAAESFSEQTTGSRSFLLGTGEVTRARCTPVRIADRVVGALIEVVGDQAADRAPARLAGASSGFRSEAWRELERNLAVFALGPSDRLRLVGEQGSGKAELAEHDAQAFVDWMDEFLGGPVTLIDDAGATTEVGQAAQAARSRPGPRSSPPHTRVSRRSLFPDHHTPPPRPGTSEHRPTRRAGDQPCLPDNNLARLIVKRQPRSQYGRYERSRLA